MEAREMGDVFLFLWLLYVWGVRVKDGNRTRIGFNASQECGRGKPPRGVQLCVKTGI